VAEGIFQACTFSLPVISPHAAGLEQQNP